MATIYFRHFSGSWEWIEEQEDEVYIKGFAGLLEAGLIPELAPDWYLGAWMWKGLITLSDVGHRA